MSGLDVAGISLHTVDTSTTTLDGTDTSTSDTSLIDGVGCCTAPERPPPPIVGKVTHHSIEMYWEEALTSVNKNAKKGDGRTKVCVQEEDKHGGWGNVYTGYSKKHIIDGLEPWSQYKYRIRFQNDHGPSEWSACTMVSTVKEPLTGEHLHKAILLQDMGKLHQVLESGDLHTCDTLDKYGFTPLMQAAQKGYIEFIEELVNAGADINYQNESGKTALMLACFQGRVASVKELRHFGANFDQQDKGGSTAFHWAMDSKNTELIDYLIDEGANIEAKDYNGWTPLLRVAAVGGDREVANLLLRNNCDLNVRDRDGKTALMIAVVNGHQGMVELLLEKDADVEVKNEYGKSALDMANAMERRRVTKVLIEHMEKRGIKVHI